MDRNLGFGEAWASKKDYDDDEEYGVNGNSSKGPITVLKSLNSETSSWDNIDPIENYTYNNNPNGTNEYGYQKLEIENGVGKLTSQDGNTITEIEGKSRARLFTLEELYACQEANSGYQPAYLFTNLSQSIGEYGYWLLTSDFSWFATTLNVSNEGPINSNFVDARYGIRPVIELSK